MNKFLLVLAILAPVCIVAMADATNEEIRNIVKRKADDGIVKVTEATPPPVTVATVTEATAPPVTVEKVTQATPPPVTVVPVTQDTPPVVSVVPVTVVSEKPKVTKDAEPTTTTTTTTTTDPPTTTSSATTSLPFITCILAFVNYVLTF